MKNLSPRTLEVWDKRTLWHPFTQQYHWEKDPLLIIERGKGAYLYDIKGRKFLDGVSSLWLNLHGHNHPALNRAIIRQVKKISHSTFLGLSHTPAIRFGKALVDVAPPGLRRVFYSDNGATAVEVALKMAFQYGKEISSRNVDRNEFLAFRGSYHGDTLGGVSVGSIGAFHSKFKPLLFKVHFAESPACFRCPFNKKGLRHRFRVGEVIKDGLMPGKENPETGCKAECLADLESKLKKNSKKLAAMIIEPIIQGAAGMVVQPVGYLSGVQKLARKYGVNLIVDEVATGFGRTGTLFASEQEHVNPDLLCLGKSITGGYTPLAATLTQERFYKAFYAPFYKGKTFFHGHSYTAHPLGAAAALASLELIHKTKLLEKTRRKAHLLRDELSELAGLPWVGSLRQAGLMAGIELVSEKSTNTPFPSRRRMGISICKKLLSKGIWIRPLGDTLVLLPPPVTSEKDLKFLVRSVRNVIVHECKTS